MTNISNPAAGDSPPKTAFWRDKGMRAVLAQIVVVGVLGFLIWYLASNAIYNMENQGIQTGFAYLSNEAGFAISKSMIDYSAASNYGSALMVGVLNTIHVAVLGIFLATLIGVLVGIARLSSNYLVRLIATIYIDGLRNIPLLLQLILWYGLLNAMLPRTKQAYNLGDSFFLSKKGLYFPVPADHVAWDLALGGVVIAIIITWFVKGWAQKRQDATGQQFPMFRAGLGIMIGVPFLLWAIGGAPTEMDVPALKGFNFRGGEKMLPEFMALLFGLTIYTAAFIAEVVRAGIQSVSHGQTEAADSLGLKRSVTMRLIILPQALRVIIPPTANQYLNLTKNSSLAVAIGYPDIVNVTGTTLNQTGQAIEAIAIMMTIYLTLSLLTAAFMNWYNNKIQLVER